MERAGSSNSVQVSVIVPSWNSSKTIQRCLQALQDQTGDCPYEIIVVDSSTDGTSEMVARHFPTVRLLHFSDRCFPGDARNLGIAQARGQILAFTDADCIVERDWIVTLVEAHKNPSPNIGGSVDIGNPERPVTWAAYFCEFSQWIPQSESRHMVEIPTCNLSLKRWIFEQHGPFLAGTRCSDTAFHWKLGQAGFPPLFVPAIRISHLNIDQLRRFLRHEFHLGWAFARIRITERKLGLVKQYALLLGSPALPLLLFYRIARRVFRARTYRRQFLLFSPLVFLGVAAWSAGEFIGYLLGPRGPRA